MESSGRGAVYATGRSFAADQAGVIGRRGTVENVSNSRVVQRRGHTQALDLISKDNADASILRDPIGEGNVLVDTD